MKIFSHDNDTTLYNKVQHKTQKTIPANGSKIYRTPQLTTYTFPTLAPHHPTQIARQRKAENPLLYVPVCGTLKAVII